MAPDHVQRWEQCLAYFREQLPRQQYDNVFSVITSSSFHEGGLTLNVPSQYFVEQLEERYATLLDTALDRYYGPGTVLYYNYDQVSHDPQSAVTIRSAKPSPAAPAQGGAFRRPAPDDIASNLNAVYTFENYCASECNQVPLTIARSIADDPSNKTFNPFLVFGATGVGKTHLIQAVGLRLKERNPRQRVLYVTARLFETQFTTASHEGRINDFFSFYQSIDTLIVDDVQDIAKKPATQNTFFHIFNHLHQNQRQIIMSSDCAPADMEGFEERMLSRFKWGISARLDQPDIELRRAVLRLKSAQDGLALPDDILEYLAANVTQSVRELEGITLSLITHSMVLKRPITLDLARAVMASSVRQKQRKEITIDGLLDTVCEYYGVEPDMLLSKSRKRPVSDARQLVMYLAKKATGLSLKAIGTHMRRDHATVIHAIRTVTDRLAVDSRLQNDLREIEHSLHL